jgi:hypothetical protein
MIQVQSLLKGVYAGVNLNREESSYFKPGKGPRQGDPISPLPVCWLTIKNFLVTKCHCFCWPVGYLEAKE